MRRWLFVLFGFRLAAALAAEPLSLSDAVRRTLDGHPELDVARARLQGATHLKDQAAARPNPRLFLQSENTRFTGQPGFRYGTDADTFVYLSQVLETGGKRQLRTDLASSKIQLAEGSLALTRAQLVANVKSAYWLAEGAQRARDILKEDLTRFAEIVTYNRNRFREGMIAEVDVIRLELEQKRLQVVLQNAEADAEKALGNLTQAMGASPQEWLLTEPLSGDVNAPAIDIDAAISRRREHQLAQSAEASASKSVLLQQAQAKPDVDVLGGYKRTAGYDTIIAGAQIVLPLFDKNRGNIAAAVAGVKESEAVTRATDMRIRAEIEAAQRDWQIRRETVTRTLGPMRDQAEENARLAQGAYREGGTDLLRLLDAQRTRLEVQLLYTRALAEYNVSVVQLEAALGLEP